MGAWSDAYGRVQVADLLAQLWVWVADAFEDMPLMAITTALAFFALIGGAVAVFGP